jgi:hypothetical protein
VEFRTKGRLAIDIFTPARVTGVMAPSPLFSPL